MTVPHKILVAGGDMLYVELMERFDRRTCLVTYCATQGQVLDRGSDASLVIVNLDIAGGAEDLCRRLRTEAASAAVPIVVVAPAGLPRYPDVDEQVPAGDLELLVDAIKRVLPAPKAVPPAAPGDDDAFDVESHTGMWRWDESSAESWPPPPPEPSGDVTAFTREYAGYVNSLQEAYGYLDQLSPSEVERLQERSQQVVDRTDEVLSLTQNAVNDALKRGELGTMREMSNARNVLYEKMRQLRTALRDLRERPAGAVNEDQPADDAVAVIEDQPATAASERPTRAQAVESEITRAARAKEAERRQRPRQAPLRRPRPARGTRRRRVTGTAKKAGKGGSWVLLAVPLLVVGAVVAAVMLMRDPASAPAKKGPVNHAPAMQSVVLQHTGEGVRAEAKAVDVEGDPISFFFRWRVNGKPAGSAGPLLAPTVYKTGDSVQAEVTPSDPMSRGTAMLSQPMTIP